MPSIENLDFLNENSLREFPIRESCSCLDTSGVFRIPNNFIVDALFSISSDPSLRLYISRVINLPNEVEIEVKAIGGTDPAGTFSIPTDTHERYTTYTMTASSAYSGATGKLTIDQVTDISLLPIGTFLFNSTATEFEMRTVIPGTSSISRFIFKNADGTSFSITGDVIIQARSNVKFRQINGTTAAIDAGENLGLNAACADDRPCLKTINGVAPDESGDFIITTSDCAKLTPITSGTQQGLNLEDTCCKPCLSCNEIGDLTERLMQIESDLLQLRQYYDGLEKTARQLTTLATSDCSCD